MLIALRACLLAVRKKVTSSCNNATQRKSSKSKYPSFWWQHLSLILTPCLLIAFRTSLRVFKRSLWVLLHPWIVNNRKTFTQTSATLIQNFTTPPRVFNTLHLKSNTTPQTFRTLLWFFKVLVQVFRNHHWIFKTLLCPCKAPAWVLNQLYQFFKILHLAFKTVQWLRALWILQWARS